MMIWDFCQGIIHKTSKMLKTGTSSTTPLRWPACLTADCASKAIRSSGMFAATTTLVLRRLLRSKGPRRATPVQSARWERNR